MALDGPGWSWIILDGPGGPGRSWMALGGPGQSWVILDGCVSWMDGWICWRMHLHVVYGFQDVVRVSGIDGVDTVGVGSLEHTPVCGGFELGVHRRICSDL